MVDVDKPQPTRGERAVSWAKAISILAATGLALYAAVLKGEPGADEAKTRVDQTWKQLRVEVNKLSAAYNRLHLRVVYFQAHEEGSRAGALQSKLDQLRAKCDRISAKNARTKKAVQTTAVPRSKRLEERRLREALARRERATKATKGATQQLQQLPAPPPWKKK